MNITPASNCGFLFLYSECKVVSGDILAKGDMNKGANNGMKTAMDSLVTAGTITQAQEDAILGS